MNKLIKEILAEDKVDFEESNPGLAFKFGGVSYTKKELELRRIKRHRLDRKMKKFFSSLPKGCNGDVQ